MIYQSISKDPIVKHMVKCRYCKKLISEKACGLFPGPLLTTSPSC